MIQRGKHDLILKQHNQNVILINLLYTLQAGIEANQLIIIYKEEAVLSYFHYLHNSSDHVHHHDDIYNLLRANKYMIVDLGGKCHYTITFIFHFDLPKLTALRSLNFFLIRTILSTSVYFFHLLSTSPKELCQFKATWRKYILVN